MGDNCSALTRRPSPGSDDRRALCFMGWRQSVGCVDCFRIVFSESGISLKITTEAFYNKKMKKSVAIDAPAPDLDLQRVTGDEWSSRASGDTDTVTQ